MSLGHELAALIDSSPGVHAGRPLLAGTGVTVKRIAVWYRLGHEPGEIAREIGGLSLAQVHAALAYYHLHQDEIEQDIEADERAYDEAERAESGV